MRNNSSKALIETAREQSDAQHRLHANNTAGLRSSFSSPSFLPPPTFFRLSCPQPSLLFALSLWQLRLHVNNTAGLRFSFLPFSVLLASLLFASLSYCFTCMLISHTHTQTHTHTHTHEISLSLSLTHTYTHTGAAGRGGDSAQQLLESAH